MAPIDSSDLFAPTISWNSGTPFGRVGTAMITPFTQDGALDLDGAQKLAAHFVAAGNDLLVVSGTTGEAPTTTDAEKTELLKAVIAAVGDRVTVVAGIGTNDTRHTLELTRAAEAAGAHGLLAVTPYYNKPTQEGLYRHFTAIADATGLPVMLYDIPPRSGIPIEVETIVRLAEHPRIVAVKDAKGDLAAASWAMARTDLAYYSGEDALNLPLLSVGAVGVVSVASHVATPEIRSMVAAYLAGETGEAARIHRRLLPVYSGIFRLPGVIMAKAAMNRLGLPGGPVRLPLVDATSDQIAQLELDLAAGGVHL